MLSKSQEFEEDVYLLDNLNSIERNIYEGICEFNRFVKLFIDYIKKQINKKFSENIVCEKNASNIERNYIKGTNGTFLPVVFSDPLDLTSFGSCSKIKILLYRKNCLEECFNGIYDFLSYEFRTFNDENLLKKYKGILVEDILDIFSGVIGIEDKYGKYFYLGDI